MPKLLIENQLSNFLLEKIHSTKKRIYAFFFYARIYKTKPNYPTTKIFNALVESKNKNIDIKILINNQVDDNKPMRANKQFCAMLAAAGIDARLSPKGRLTHAKFWIFDDYEIIIGSHNISYRSLKLNREVSVYLEDFTINQELSRYFLKEFLNLEE